MEEDFSHTIPKYGGMTSGDTPPSSPRFPDISFAPQDATVQRKGGASVRERCATAGVVLGGVAIVFWFVIVVGIIASLAGIFCSLAGRNSSRAKYARIGLILSIVGGVVAFIYMLVIYMGLINYNYFTNELWGIPSGGVQTLE